MFEYMLREPGEPSPGPLWEAVSPWEAAMRWRLREIEGHLLADATTTRGLPLPSRPAGAPIEDALEGGARILFRRWVHPTVTWSNDGGEVPPWEDPVDLADLSSTPDHEDAPTPEPETRPAWIEIALVDDDDAPIVDRPYRLILSDGTRREGRLDATGVIRFDDVEAGLCTLELPTQDESEWAPDG